MKHLPHGDALSYAGIAFQDIVWPGQQNIVNMYDQHTQEKLKFALI